MAVTLQNLTDIAYDILREAENVKAYPLSFMQQLMNTAQLRICSGMVKNPVTGETVRKWRLPFLSSTAFYDNVMDISLSADAVVWGATLTTADTSLYPTAWKLYIRGNIITYTGTTATQFTGVTGIEYTHKAGSNVGIVYDLPTDYMNVTNLIYNDSFKLEFKRYDDIYESFNANKGNSSTRIYESWYSAFNGREQAFYTTLDDLYLVLFNIRNNNKQIRVRYEKVPTEMTATTDIATIANDLYAKATIPYIAVWELLYNRGEERRASEIINFWLGQVKEMFDFYNKRSSEDINGVQYWMAKGRLNV